MGTVAGKSAVQKVEKKTNKIKKTGEQTLRKMAADKFDRQKQSSKGQNEADEDYRSLMDPKLTIDEDEGESSDEFWGEEVVSSSDEEAGDPQMEEESTELTEGWAEIVDEDGNVTKVKTNLTEKEIEKNVKTDATLEAQHANQRKRFKASIKRMVSKRTV